MKKMLSLTAICALSMPAVAADPYYGSIGGGVYQLQTDGFDDTAPTMKVTGGYQFSEVVALEGSYTRLFETTENVEGSKVDVDGNVWELSTKWSVPLGERFSPYARLGWSYVELNAVASDEEERVSANFYDNAFTWGVGTDVNLTRRLTVNGELARINIDEGDLDTASVNLTYRFGSL